MFTPLFTYTSIFRYCQEPHPVVRALYAMLTHGDSRMEGQFLFIEISEKFSERNIECPYDIVHMLKMSTTFTGFNLANSFP
jgi:hypothetical protein